MEQNNVNNAILETAKAASAAFPACPRRPYMPKYHERKACQEKPSRPTMGSDERGGIYQMLKYSGQGASLVPDQETRVCPLDDAGSMESSMAIKGFDTTWIVENTSKQLVVLAWVVDGVEVSPFEPGRSALEDPKCLLKPGDWTSVPTFESFVYHVREFNEENPGKPGRIVLQHRAGMVPLGKKYNQQPDPRIDPEPFDKRSLQPNAPKQEVGRNGVRDRPCNIIDVGFRNEAGFPLSVYYASNLETVPDAGFSCSEKYQFHMGNKAAPQDFMWDWSSKTKYEGAFIGHTFVARRADNPEVIIDKYTLEPTHIVDCPNRKQDPQAEAAAAIPAKQENDVQNPNRNNPDREGLDREGSDRENSESSCVNDENTERIAMDNINDVVNGIRDNLDEDIPLGNNVVPPQTVDIVDANNNNIINDAEPPQNTNGNINIDDVVPPRTAASAFSGSSA